MTIKPIVYDVPFFLYPDLESPIIIIAVIDDVEECQPELAEVCQPELVEGGSGLIAIVSINST